MFNDINLDAQLIVQAIVGGIFIAFCMILNFILFDCRTSTCSIIGTMFSHTSAIRCKISLVCGFLTGTYGLFILFGHNITVGNITISLFDDQSMVQRSFNIFEFALGGLLVGFGSRLKESNYTVKRKVNKGLPFGLFINTVIFIALGIITATAKSCYSSLLSIADISMEIIEQHKIIANFLYALLLIYFVYDLNTNSILSREKLKIFLYLIIGFVYGLGLSISGICKRTYTLSFLNMKSVEGWNPAFGVMICTIAGINLVIFNTIRKQKPIFAEGFETVNEVTNWQVITGYVLYGISWGLTGLYSDTAIINGLLLIKATVYLPFIIIGYWLLNWIYHPKQNKVEGSEIDKKVKDD